MATLVGQQGQVLSMLSTLITQTRPAIATTTQSIENPKSPTSEQLTDNFFCKIYETDLTDDEFALLSSATSVILSV